MQVSKRVEYAQRISPVPRLRKRSGTWPPTTSRLSRNGPENLCNTPVSKGHRLKWRDARPAARAAVPEQSGQPHRDAAGRSNTPLSGGLLQSFLRLGEAPGVRLLGLGQSLEPVRDFGETFLARRLRHPGI